MNNSKVLIFLFALGVLVAGTISYVLITISAHKTETLTAKSGIIKPMSDDDVNPESWGVNFPSQYSSYKQMEDLGHETPFGGSVPYSKLIRKPALTSLWAGYPFSADFNEERTHAYAQIDQMETKRNNKEWLNSHGFPAFKGQPGACMNCHSGHTPGLIKELGWAEFNKKPYTELKEILMTKYGEGIHNAALGGTCADCHNPKDMSLRVTRPGFINAMIERGYTADENSGIKGTQQEMRSYVCTQCHVEYYFKKDTSELTFPWKFWPKDKPFRIEMFDQYYDSVRDKFPQDWKHKLTGAPMLKMQHPEAELDSSGIHARNNVACADCHMPFMREGARKITNHNIRSPLDNLNASCQTCHRVSEDNLRDRVLTIQRKTASSLNHTEGALLALIQDIQKAQELLRQNSNFIAGKDKDAIEAAIDNLLKEPREFHRKASMRWDFISSENSTGFHSPAEAQRVLGQAIDLARQGQISLVHNLNSVGIKLDITVGAGKIPDAPEPIKGHSPNVGDPPSKELIEMDKNLENLF